jgi:hypothetical protein
VVGIQLATEGLANDQFLRRYAPALQGCQPAADEPMHFRQEVSSMLSVGGFGEDIQHMLLQLLYEIGRVVQV